MAEPSSQPAPGPRSEVFNTTDTPPSMTSVGSGPSTQPAHDPSVSAAVPRRGRRNWNLDK